MDDVEASKARRLPVEYLHVVFTVPAAVAENTFWNEAAVSKLLFRASAQTMATIAATPRTSARGSA